MARSLPLEILRLFYGRGGARVERSGGGALICNDDCVLISIIHIFGHQRRSGKQYTGRQKLVQSSSTLCNIINMSTHSLWSPALFIHGLNRTLHRLCTIGSRQGKVRLMSSSTDSDVCSHTTMGNVWRGLYKLNLTLVQMQVVEKHVYRTPAKSQGEGILHFLTIPFVVHLIHICGGNQSSNIR